MSIHTGKAGYNSTESWINRTAEALAERGRLYNYDMGLDDKNPSVVWIKETLARYPKVDILEVGSGFGKWAKVLEGAYKTYTGVEIVPARVQHAAELYGSHVVNFVQLTPDWDLHRQFKIILCVTVIQHLTYPLAVDVLKGIARHLAPDGFALLSEGRIFDVTESEAEEMYARPSNAPHMIPKPLSMFKRDVPELTWGGSDGRYYLRRK